MVLYAESKPHEPKTSLCAKIGRRLHGQGPSGRAVFTAQKGQEPWSVTRKDQREGSRYTLHFGASVCPYDWGERIKSERPSPFLL